MTEGSFASPAGPPFVAVSKRVHLNVASEALEYFESGLSKH